MRIDEVRGHEGGALSRRERKLGESAEREEWQNHREEQILINREEGKAAGLEA